MSLNLFLSPAHKCGYLPGLNASTLFVDPGYPINPAMYQIFLEQGFRRSGSHVYRPHCASCQACTPVRIPVTSFHPSRSLKRIWQRNQDLQIDVVPPDFNRERFALYRDYINDRHSEGSMANPTPEDFVDFLTSTWSHTYFVEFREGSRLLAVAVVDFMDQALSAVYTFFDPAAAYRSLGTLAVLWEIEQARRSEREWLYLGYWIENCKKMTYKTRFRPLQAYRFHQWRPLYKAGE